MDIFDHIADETAQIRKSARMRKNFTDTYPPLAKVMVKKLDVDMLAEVVSICEKTLDDASTLRDFTDNVINLDGECIPVDFI